MKTLLLLTTVPATLLLASCGGGGSSSSGAASGPISANPSSLTMQTALGSNTSGKITFTANSTILIGDVGIPTQNSAFAVTQGSSYCQPEQVLQAGQSCSVKITFTPLADKTYQDKLELEYVNGSKNPTSKSQIKTLSVALTGKIGTPDNPNAPHLSLKNGTALSYYSNFENPREHKAYYLLTPGKSSATLQNFTPEAEFSEGAGIPPTFTSKGITWEKDLSSCKVGQAIPADGCSLVVS